MVFRRIEFIEKERNLQVLEALQAIGKGISQDKVLDLIQWLKGGNGYTEDAAIDV